MKVEYPKKKTNKKELLPQIVERIFSICKTDSNFPLKNIMTSVDDRLHTMQVQLSKQDGLVQQSKTLTTNIVTRLNNLRQSNQELRDRLLEALGSEL